MKRIISFAAAVIMAFSGIGNLAYDVSAATNTTSTTTKSTEKRTGKLLTYEEAYDRLKDLEFAKGTTTDSKTANKTTDKTTNKNTNKTTTKTTDKTTTKTTKNKNTSTTSVVTMTDYKGKAISSEMYVFRNSLNDEEQEIYDLIKDAIDRGDTEIHLDKSYEQKELFKIFSAVYYDNPYMVWLKQTFSKVPFGQYKDKNTYRFDYIDKFNKDRETTIQLMDDYLKPVLDKASKLRTDVEKVKYIHDYIIYSTKFELSKVGEIGIAGTPYSIIVNKKGVCEGYSRTFTYCLQKLGITSICISGIASNNEGTDLHMWNQVKLDGEWYVVDVLWDEVDNSVAVSTDYSYYYFLKTNDIFTGTYVRKITMKGLTVPTPNGTKYSPDNYSYTNGTDFSDLAKVVITSKKKTLNASKSKSSTSKSKTTLPSGWYKYKPILTRLGKDTLNKSDWTKDGNFYYIEKERNGKGLGVFIVYDVEYDNYYVCNRSVKYITWYNYSKGTWQMLK